MRLELQHAVILFFAMVFVDFLVFVFSGGESYYSVGGFATTGFLVVPAAMYLLACFVFASSTLRLIDKTYVPKHTTTDRLLPWVLVIIVVLLVTGVSGEAFFSIDALSRQVLFQENQWIPMIVLFTLPMAMMAVICATSWTRLIMFVFLVSFFSLTGSRIHVMALIVALVAAHSDRKVKLRHLIFVGVLGIFILDFLATLRESAMQKNDIGAGLIQMFSTGHYATFDIQTLLMHPDESLALSPWYVLIALIGPLRQVLGLQWVLSSSEYFTATMDPGRYYSSFSAATVGLSGELYMIVGWFGAILIGVFTGLVALLKRFLEWLSNFNQQMQVLLRSLGFLYLFLLLRSDMWIFFVYLWIQLPVLTILALYFAKARSRR